MAPSFALALLSFLRLLTPVILGCIGLHSAASSFTNTKS